MDRTKELISCIFQVVLDRAIEILQSGDFDKRVIENVGVFQSPFPLSWILWCNDLLLNNDDWVEEHFKSVILPTRRNLQKLFDYFNQNNLMRGNLDFSKFPEERGHFVGWELDEMLDGTLDELVAKGYNADECKLCHAVLTGNLEEINRQIEKKTNPDVWISGNFAPGVGNVDDGESYNALINCSTFYCDAFDCYNLRGIYDRGMSNELDLVTYENLKELVEAAFYQYIENRFAEYSKKR